MPTHSFGIKADIRDNICYLDEQTVIYPVGSNLVIHMIETKTQRFLQGTEKSEGITSVAVSPNRKFVAVAERAPEGERATCTIYDLVAFKRKKVRDCRRRNSRAPKCAAPHVPFTPSRTIPARCCQLRWPR